VLNASPSRPNHASWWHAIMAAARDPAILRAGHLVADGRSLRKYGD
jgi:hypothetical protein